MPRRPKTVLFVAMGVLLVSIGLLHHAVQSGAAPSARRKITIAVGTPSPDMSLLWLMMAKALGYWSSEGNDVDILGGAGAAQVVQHLVAGQAQFGMVNANLLIQARLDTGASVRGVMNAGAIDWGVGVMADGPITDVHDLRGKRIGISSLAVGGRALLAGYLRDNGIDPDRDVQLIPVGVGAPALEAFQNGRVDALMFWGTALTGFQNAGAKLRILVAPTWLTLPDFTLATMDSTLKSDPALVESISRGIAKSILFVETNPTCARQLFLRAYPEQRSSASNDPAAEAKDMAIIQAQLRMLANGRRINGGVWTGAIDPAAYDRLSRLMVEQGVLSRFRPAQNYVVSSAEYFSAVNHFDKAPIIEAARKCAT